MKKLWILLLFIPWLSSCAPPPPHRQLNICQIFREYPHWYWDAQHSERKWGTPISVQMAIIHEESHFRADAKPPREHLLGFIPWFRPTSASGYVQAINGTWRLYVHDTHQFSASRDDMAKATDFVGWFTYRAHKDLGIPQNNTFELYLAYHQGLEGYARRTYWHDAELIQIAHSVQNVANLYHYQLVRCASSLPRHHWWDV